MCMAHGPALLPAHLLMARSPCRSATSWSTILVRLGARLGRPRRSGLEPALQAGEGGGAGAGGWIWVLALCQNGGGAILAAPGTSRPCALLQALARHPLLSPAPLAPRPAPWLPAARRCGQRRAPAHLCSSEKDGMRAWPPSLMLRDAGRSSSALSRSAMELLRSSAFCSMAACRSAQAGRGGGGVKNDGRPCAVRGAASPVASQPTDAGLHVLECPISCNSTIETPAAALCRVAEPCSFGSSRAALTRLKQPKHADCSRIRLYRRYLLSGSVESHDAVVEGHHLSSRGSKQENWLQAALHE